MFPYKIRNPAFGGARNLGGKKPKKSNSARNAGNDRIGDGAKFVRHGQLKLGSPLFADFDDSEIEVHSVGGNLQRSILLDLEMLRKLFYSLQFCEKETTHTYHAVNLQNGHLDHSSHRELGSCFRLFKKAFRDSRFGAIHTRTIPPRIDRGEYEQLLYSCCFYFLEESIGKCSFCDQLSWDYEDQSLGSNRPRAIDAIFSVFCLYALHEINPLPEVMLPRFDLDNERRGNEEEYLRKAWTMLPIGSTDDTLHRRCFRSPVRINRWNYFLLLQLRDVCSARVFQCEVDELIPNFFETAISSKCHCGPPRDAIYIIDKMVHSDSYFEFCEYHGPCSLEGLAGNPNFYNAYFRSECNKANLCLASQELSSRVMVDAQLADMGNMSYLKNPRLELEKLGSTLKTHRANISALSSQLRAARQPGGDLKPKQREIVEKTLLGSLQSVPKYVGIIDAFYPAIPSKTTTENDESNPQTPNFTHPSETQFVITAVTSPFVFSNKISENLSKCIRESLSTFTDVIASVRRDLVNERMKRQKELQSCRHFDVSSHADLFDDAFKDLEEAEVGQSLKEDLNGNTFSSNHRLERVDDTFLEAGIEGVDFSSRENFLEMDEGESLASGMGKNALNDLLALAGRKSSLPRNRQLSSWKNPRNHPHRSGFVHEMYYSTSSDDSSLGDDEASSCDNDTQTNITGIEINDDSTVISGAGKRAIQYLLDCTSNVANSTSTTTGRSKKALSITDYRDDSEDETVSSGAGKKALQTLLSKARNQFSPPGMKNKSSASNMKEAARSRRPTNPGGSTTQQRTNSETYLNTSDDDTLSSGAGKKALQTLLLKARDEFSPPGMKNKSSESNMKVAARSCRPTVTEGSFTPYCTNGETDKDAGLYIGNDGESTDGDTVISGAGKKALDTQLLQVSGLASSRGKKETVPLRSNKRLHRKRKIAEKDTCTTIRHRDGNCFTGDGMVTSGEKENGFEGSMKFALNEHTNKSPRKRENLDLRENEDDTNQSPGVSSQKKSCRETNNTSLPEDINSVDPSIANSPKFHDDDFSLATDTGSNALTALLAKVQKN